MSPIRPAPICTTRRSPSAIRRSRPTSPRHAPAGTLESEPSEAWGNAAIPGFGIGRPTRAPELDPAARPEAVVPDAPVAEATSDARFEIPGEALVLAALPESALTIYAGTPQAVTAEARSGLWLALAGVAALIVGAAVLVVGLGAAP